MPDQIGYFASLKNVAGKIFTYLASITLTGTDGKTITVTQDTSLDEAVAMSSKAPKASPAFTGDVTGTTANNNFAAQNPTNTGLFYTGGAGSITLLDNQSVTFTIFSGDFTILDNDTGDFAMFLSPYTGAIVIISDPGSKFVATDTDSGKWAVFKSAPGDIVTIKNYCNVTRHICVNVRGVVQSSTAPA